MEIIEFMLSCRQKFLYRTVWNYDQVKVNGNFAYVYTFMLFEQFYNIKN
jgi:hypothetical protein